MNNDAHIARLEDLLAWSAKDGDRPALRAAIRALSADRGEAVRERDGHVVRHFVEPGASPCLSEILWRDGIRPTKGTHVYLESPPSPADHSTFMEGWHSAVNDAGELFRNAPDDRYANRASNVVTWIKAHPPWPAESADISEGAMRAAKSRETASPETNATADAFIAAVNPAAPSQVSDAMVERAAIGWNACRRQVYALTEATIDGLPVEPNDFQRGQAYEAKCIAKAMCAFEARDCDQLNAALEAARPQPGRVEGMVSIRQAVADYMQSEGCSCCRDIDAHPIHAKRLAELLGVPAHPEQDDWHDFSPYRSKP